MKKTYLLLLLLCILSLSACSKRYVCTCYDLSGSAEPTRIRYKNETRAQAEAKCAAAEAGAISGKVNCELEG